MTDEELRLTPQRRAVLEVLAASADHPTAGQVLSRVREQLPDVGPATVYRTLALLVESGSVAEVQLGDGRATRYDRTPQRHDHLVCTVCGKVEDVTVPLAPHALDHVSSDRGFVATTYAVSIQGRCGACAAAAEVITQGKEIEG